jgi:hypothetical protein
VSLSWLIRVTVGRTLLDPMVIHVTVERAMLRSVKAVKMCVTFRVPIIIAIDIEYQLHNN